MNETQPQVRLPVTVSRATNVDMPDLAAIELASFTDILLTRILVPGRAALVDSGVTVHNWPDYPSRVQQYQRKLLSNELVFKATSTLDGETLGMAVYNPGRPRADRSWSDWVWGDLIYPMMDRVGFGIKKKGVDMVFLLHYVGEVLRTRNALMKDRVYATLEIFAVHPEFRGHGVGSALLRECTALADAAGLPIVLESTDAAVSVYERHGFKMVSQLSLEYKGTQLSLPVMLREPVL